MEVHSHFLLVLNILFVRELQSRLKSITVNTVNPGLCKSDFTRGLSGAQLEQTKRNQEEVGFSTEEGSRQLVFAATTRAISENELKGAYLSYMELRETSEYSRSRKGVAAQRRVWVSCFCFSKKNCVKLTLLVS